MNPTPSSTLPWADVQILGPMRPGYEEVLTAPAVEFVADLARRFGDRVGQLMARRRQRQRRFDAGDRPDFPAESASIRAGHWTVASLPDDLLDRRVEITGPVDRKMIINALNSGANVFMADFEDSTSPTWDNLVAGQVNLRDAVAGTIRFVNDAGKHYQLNGETATLMVRPRGWHLVEKHFRVDEKPIPAGIFDFGLFFFHNARALIDGGSGPYFYLPKMESHLEARLWNDIFVHAQEALGIPRRTIKATVLIETLPAAFEMDEILWELREHSAGLNCGRWDYIFSFIKTFRNHPDRVLPDRSQVTMQQPFLRAYAQLLIRICHRRQVHAMGGMAAQVPIKDDPVANEEALEKVRTDKLREVADGHDGTWVAHPGLVPLARAVFDAHMPQPNQIQRTRAEVQVTAEDLCRLPTGTRTEAGLRHNVRVGVQYLEAWLGGQGCVPLYHLMEDAATAEICRTQVWQWIRHGSTLDDGRTITETLFGNVLDEEMARLRDGREPARLDAARTTRARDLFVRLCTARTCENFLTLAAYEQLDRLAGPSKE
ncbi:MAG: malate synthase A [Planctomycetes bacterium]|nr:malate synthase A [Planctomycetota bacterium]